MKNIFVLALACLSLSSCSSMMNKLGAGSEKMLILGLYANKDINSDVLGDQSPLAITVYQLSDDKQFLKASYQQLMGSNISGVISKKSVVIWPGKRPLYKMILMPGTKAIGITAGYRKLENKQWRLVKSLGVFSHSLYIVITHQGIEKLGWFARLTKKDIDKPTVENQGWLSPLDKINKPKVNVKKPDLSDSVDISGPGVKGGEQ